MPWIAPVLGLALTAASAGASAAGGAGKKVQTPVFNRTDPQAEQLRSIAGNQAALPAIGGLSADTNAVNQEQLMQLLRSSIPGYDSILSKSSDNLGSMLKGELPTDVVDQIKRHTAERGAAGGFKGSEFSRNLTARDLGRSSLDLSQFATSYAPNWLASAKATGTARPFDPASMFVSPGLQIGNEQANNQGAYSRDLYAAQMAAAPDPTAAALAKLTGGVGGALASYGFSSMGGGGGGGVGSPGWGGISGYGGNTYYPNAGGTSYSARA